MTNSNNVFHLSSRLLIDCYTPEDVVNMFEQRLKVKQLEIELEFKRSLSKIEEKHKNVIAEVDAKCRISDAERDNALNERDNALNERDIARQEKCIAMAQNELLVIELSVCLKQINTLKQRPCTT